MSTTVRTTRGASYSGRSVESIVRRVWGRTATVRYSNNRNDSLSARLASVVVPSRYGDTVDVLAELILDPEQVLYADGADSIADFTP